MTHHRRIGDVLSDRTVVQLNASISVGEAARRMRDSAVGAVLIFNGEDLAGIFTERDLLERVVAEGRDPDSTRLGEVMTATPLRVEVDMTIVDAARTMKERRLRHLPVTREGKIVGVVSVRDFLHDDLAQYLL